MIRLEENFSLTICSCLEFLFKYRWFSNHFYFSCFMSNDDWMAKARLKDEEVVASMEIEALKNGILVTLGLRNF